MRKDEAQSRALRDRWTLYEAVKKKGKLTFFSFPSRGRHAAGFISPALRTVLISRPRRNCTLKPALARHTSSGHRSGTTRR
jgi:hypothetical protein